MIIIRMKHYYKQLTNNKLQRLYLYMPEKRAVQKVRQPFFN